MYLPVELVELEKVQLMPGPKRSWQVKGQPEFIYPVKSQSKYLVSQTFDPGRRSEYMIYWSAIPGSFGIYDTYGISILGHVLINYVTSEIKLNGLAGYLAR